MALIFEIVVIPNASIQKWSIDKHARLKCFIKSAPERGKANKELIKFLAQSLECSQAEIEIVGGLTHRVKRIKIHQHISLECIYKKLNIVMEKQHAIF